MSWQYTFARWPGERHRSSIMFRANDFCLERLFWNLDGTFAWKIVRLLRTAS